MNRQRLITRTLRLRLFFSFFVFFSFCLFCFSSLFCLNSQAAIVIGNPNGKVTLTEVFDYQCPHCHRMYPLIEELIDQHPNLKVRLLPVAILNQTSLVEAAAAIAATQLPGKFQALSNIMMSARITTENAVYAVLKQLGLNTQDFQKAMHSKRVKKQMIEGLNTLKKYQADGVPLLVISPTNRPAEEVIFEGEQSLITLEEAINHASVN